MSNFFDSFNTSQTKAIEEKGPLLVIAGAGSGKTRIICGRAIYLLQAYNASINNILIVTFTNKAALEIKTRITNNSEQRYKNSIWPWVGTFHSICCKILRIYGENININRNFTIIDQNDQKSLLKNLLKENNISKDDIHPDLLLKKIEHWKNQGCLPEYIQDFTDENKKILSLYQQYQEMLKNMNCLDFGDLILFNLKLLSENQEIRTKLQSQFKYILIDEYQDTSTAQYNWIKSLYSHDTDLFCVGDDDQSIYGWRGAAIENILNFKENFPSANIHRLEQNYRSTAEILNFSNAIISLNKYRHGKKLWTDKNGDIVEVTNYHDHIEEAEDICTKINKILLENKNEKNIAILARSSSQFRIIEETLFRNFIKYKVIGGLKFYDREEIKDLVAYLRIINNDSDVLSLERIINKPTRSIGKVTFSKIAQYAQEHDIEIYKACKEICNIKLLSKIALNNLKNFVKLIDELKKYNEDNLVNQDFKIGYLLEKIIVKTNFINYVKSKHIENSDSKIENIYELITSAKNEDGKNKNLDDYLEHISLYSINDETESKVNLMTMHAAKGLEFSFVFLPGWEFGLFPSILSLEEHGDIGMEEERRLAYVASTRAKEKLYLSFASNRQIFGRWQKQNISNFLEEVPENLYKFNKKTYNGNIGQNDFRNNGDNFASEHNFSYVKGKQTSNYSENYSENRKYNYPTSKQLFNIGDRVLHQKFGIGEVIEVEGKRLLINFDGSIKKIVDNFVSLV